MAGLSPAAQAVLFHRLLRLNEAATTPSLIATQLRYSAMSIGRAFDELVSAGLAGSERYGKERHIRFEAEGRKLFNASHNLLRSPVRTEKFIRNDHTAPALKHGGEGALAKLTDLSPPPFRSAPQSRPAIGRMSPEPAVSSKPTGIKLPLSSKPGPTTLMPCPPRTPWIRCRSTPDSTITAMNALPWQRNNCWTKCRGNRNRQVSRSLRSARGSVRHHRWNRLPSSVQRSGSRFQGDQGHRHGTLRRGSRHPFRNGLTNVPQGRRISGPRTERRAKGVLPLPSTHRPRVSPT